MDSTGQFQYIISFDRHEEMMLKLSHFQIGKLKYNTETCPFIKRPCQDPYNIHLLHHLMLLLVHQQKMW